jgi:hypothetical protein
MQTVLLTLIGSRRQIDLQLPAEVPIDDLLPKLLELCGPPQAQIGYTQWCLVTQDKGIILTPTHSLSEGGVVDGARLLLQEYTSVISQRQQAHALPFLPRALAPSAGTGGIGVKWNLPDS